MFMKGDDNVIINHVLAVGRAVDLDCAVRHPEDVTILWYRNGQLVTGWRDAGRPTLRIRAQDCGKIVFNCTASNRYGNIIRNYHIYVRGEVYAIVFVLKILVPYWMQ